MSTRIRVVGVEAFVDPSPQGGAKKASLATPPFTPGVEKGTLGPFEAKV